MTNYCNESGNKIEQIQGSDEAVTVCCKRKCIKSFLTEMDANVRKIYQEPKLVINIHILCQNTKYQGTCQKLGYTY